MYKFNERSKIRSSEELWTDILQSLSSEKSITSITGIVYKLVKFEFNSISYQAKSRSQNRIESLNKESFELILNGLVQLNEFNTQNSKKLFIVAKIYRQRSPFFAILLNAKLIDKIKS